MDASDSGHTDVVQLLLSSGAQVDLQDTEVRQSRNYIVTLIRGHSWITNTLVNQDTSSSSNIYI